MAEAASVCLHDRGHQSGVEIEISGTYKDRFRLVWNEVTEQMQRSWSDQEVATEHGAYGIAALLIEALTNYTVIERSRKVTGFDYWLGATTSDAPLFQAKARLEVSGIRWGGPGMVNTRVRQKLKQIRTSGSSTLPAFVVVVEFGKPQSRVEKR